jgi:hypothetical protein
MSKRDDDRERERPSWRELDRRKDKSQHVDRADPYKKNVRGQRVDSSSKSYRSALDKLFDGGELPDRFQRLAKARDTLATGDGSPRQAVLKRLRNAVGQSDVVDAVKELLELDGELPREPDALLSALQHPDESIQRQAISLLKELVAERPLKRADLLRQRLRRIEDLAEDPETAKVASELRHIVP